MCFDTGVKMLENFCGVVRGVPYPYFNALFTTQDTYGI